MACAGRLTDTRPGLPAVAARCTSRWVGTSALAVHVAARRRDRFARRVPVLRRHGRRHRWAPATAAVRALGRLLRSLGPLTRRPYVHPGRGGRCPTHRSLTSTRHLLVVLDNALDAGQVGLSSPQGPDAR
ncbi:hypothetical protein [Nonomuraea dietziae]|uniref:hypothetical protein n=1 Tax=Nonomuraea dietziae TaxID=65515 RepID=UPI0031CF8370